MRVLVTGGAGFVGSHLVDRLVAHGEAVTVLDDLSTGQRAFLSDAQARGDVRLVVGSILDEDALARAFEGVGVVYHLAVRCVRASLGAPLENHEVNATGTLRVLEAARRASVRRFVYCSSSEVYGDAGAGRLSEDTTVCAPTTVYGGAKLAGELYARAYAVTYGLSVVVARPFNAYGPRSPAVGVRGEVLPRFVVRLLCGRRPQIFGDGLQARDFTYVEELAEGLWLAQGSSLARGEAVNLAFGRAVTLRELSEVAARACGRPDLTPELGQARPGDVPHLHADTRKARSLLGYEARVPLEEGVARYVAWLRAQHPDPSALLQDGQNW
jgi:UDP-glucose 4-epimerase